MSTRKVVATVAGTGKRSDHVVTQVTSTFGKTIYGVRHGDVTGKVDAVKDSLGKAVGEAIDRSGRKNK